MNLPAKAANPSPESTLFCSAEWHLSKAKSTLVPLIYSLAFRLAKNSGVFSASLRTLASYFGSGYKTVWRAVHELIKLGFFELVNEELGKPSIYRVITHEQWAENHRGQCSEKMMFPWSGENKDKLGIDLHAASGARVTFFPNQLKALRNTGLTDAEIIGRWKAFLVEDAPLGRRWKGAYYRFLKWLKKFPKAA
jgi:hypothetical protein